MNREMARVIARASSLAIVIVALPLFMMAWQNGSRPSPTSAAPGVVSKIASPIDPSAQEQTVVAAGDIVDCAHIANAEATAKLIDNIPGTVLALGDLAAPDGSQADFDCYDKTWGRHKARTRPAPGNHEHHTPGAAVYLKYFGPSVGSTGHLYYSFNLGSWHLISLDTQCDDIGGCGRGSPEEVWLREDLSRNSSACILAFGHKPLFSSGDTHGNDQEMKAFWNDLYAAGADIVVNGHDHDYERLAPQNPDGLADPARGIREFVVGTGGRNQRGFAAPLATTEVRNTKTYGVLQLRLHPDSYDWKFIPIAGFDFTDSGSGKCHTRQKPN